MKPSSNHRPGADTWGRHRRTRVFAVVSIASVAALGMSVSACGDDDADDLPTTTVPSDQPDPPDDFDESSIIGLEVDAAQTEVTAQGREFRVAEIDGEAQVLTDDLVDGRVNVEVEDGVVTGVAFIG